ncbi:hypothetical protein LB534_16500 [Mesorhizobium sp. CA18]|uniref:hypothetical protein n=1 Tax=unclassified Mesorhizobium TaxID=325217 RepID=UPI001CCCC9E7|nr:MULTISPECIES: hypothetical protein [unclassified Mesorhizobium]MBZ9734577.1 hypothetical protein [Mesorhizobium sp. CA9]MBZ9826887.1 hypothetical protein [Mesorhizobium sp. CA18]MBZ9832491.1 hypothetical protein [Mesorhizobium sp. CA2]MBZ9838453.1 hypothetical protein [Mesorhizobium sp. CA3]MBZ9878860.1 hypothetical protein [Mesorhizobium sp. Ca11]
MREPTLPPAFGRLGAKSPVAIVAASATSSNMTNLAARMREGLSSRRGLALNLAVVLWTVLVLAAVFFILQT